MAAGVPVPGGFSATAFAYREFLDKGGINGFMGQKRPEVGAPVPSGYSATALAYRESLDKGGVDGFIYQKLSGELRAVGAAGILQPPPRTAGGV